MPPLSDQKIDQDAQRSPKPRKFSFCVTVAARPSYVHWTTKTAAVAQQVVQRSHGCSRFAVHGRRMGAQWSPQCSLNGRYWSAKGGTMGVQGRQKHRSNWYTMFTTVCIFTGRPMADLCASILRPRRCACLSPASFEWPVSDRLPRRPLCDCCEYAQNFTAAMASMARSERPLCHPWTTKATIRSPLCLQRRPGKFCGRTREAQRLCTWILGNPPAIGHRWIPFAKVQQCGALTLYLLFDCRTNRQVTDWRGHVTPM